MTTDYATLRKLKSLIKKYFPRLSYLLRYIKIHILQFRSAEPIFRKIYHENFWEDLESRSGPGSNITQTKVIKQELKALVEEIGAKSLLDIPCGDFNWLKEVDLEVDYLGADIVRELIEENIKKFGNNRRRFLKLDIIQDKLPQVDLIFCRDLLVHFNNRHIFRAIKNIKQSNSKYLLATTYPSLTKNDNIVSGEWRALNLCKPPFKFPAPIKVIIEQSTKENEPASNKSLGLWRISDI